MFDVSTHTSGKLIGSLLGKINRIVKFTEDEKMVLNLKSVKRWLLLSVIPALEVNGHVFERVKSYKLLGMWIDDDLKWKTNVKYLVKKASKRWGIIGGGGGITTLDEGIKTLGNYNK